MAGTVFSGPLVTAGPLLGATAGGTPQEYGLFGPSMLYKGQGFPDLRFSVPKDNPNQGSILGNYNSPSLHMVHATPGASNQALTTAGNATNGTPFANVTAAATGITPAVPFYPWKSTSLTTAICLDMGFGTLNVSASTAAATPSTGTLYRYSPGQWIIIGNVGNAGGTIPLITQVAAVGTSTITLNANYLPLATNSAAPAGQANVFDLQSFGGQNSIANAHAPKIADGQDLFWDPLQACMRGVGVTGVSGGAGGNVLIQGWDVYGQPQSEIIVATVGATTVWGLKTYKWFGSATPQFADAHNYTVVTSDTFGFTARSDWFEYTNLWFNGTQASAAVSTSSAWTAGDQTNPATTTTGDVRGTFQISARGANATVTSTTYPDGTKRLIMFMDPGVYNMLKASPNNPAPFFGQTPI